MIDIERKIPNTNTISFLNIVFGQLRSTNSGRKWFKVNRGKTYFSPQFFHMIGKVDFFPPAATNCLATASPGQLAEFRWQLPHVLTLPL